MLNWIFQMNFMKKSDLAFEFSIIQCPELMMDRHLDQLLMCAIYVMAKVSTIRNIKGKRCYFLTFRTLLTALLCKIHILNNSPI